MKISSVLRFAPLAASLLCLSTVAQTRFCIGGDLDRLSAAEKSVCTAKLQAVKQAAAAFHAPDGWHFVMVCGQNGWKDYAAYAMDGSLLSASADTNLDEHETFLRADRLDLSNQTAFRRVVAREVAGILLQSHDEVAINHQVDAWIPQATERSGF